MFKYIAINVCLCTFLVGGTSVIPPVDELLRINTSEVFYLPFKQYFFRKGELANKTNVRYRASLESMPDLPDWMNYVHEPGGDGYLYGVPAHASSFRIEVIATNKVNYDTYREAITLNVTERQEKARNQVEIRFSNLNVEDMFQHNRLTRVVNIFKRLLWRSSREVYVTLVASAIQMGGRLPANPKDKEGVVVRVGSVEEFSLPLLELEQEVIPLRVRVPCPKDYKRTSAENYFRDDDFIPDWCGFHLHPAYPLIQKDNGPVHSPVQLTSDDFRPPSLMEPSRDLMLEFVLTVVVPTTAAMMLLLVLSFILCCYREGIEKRNKDLPSIQMVQYASIHRASNNLRSLATKREGPRTSGTTPTSTIPRSYGSSPNNTLPKTSTPKVKVDEKDSLTRQAPPPYSPANTIKYVNGFPAFLKKTFKTNV